MSPGGSEPPVLILCAPRSCSTVLCAMLGQHPQLFGFPELNLFLTSTVHELEELGGQSYLTGLFRSVAQLEFGDQSFASIAEAQRWVVERHNWETGRMLKWLLARVHPRAGIDKSPRTCLSRHASQRAFETFPVARAIHLTRHPVATLKSMVDSHIREAPEAASSQSPRWLAGFYAGLWLQAQRSILGILEHREPASYLRVQVERLLRDPPGSLPQVAAAMGVSTDPLAISAMLHPERSPFACPPPVGLPGDGDPGFQSSPCLRPLVQDAGKLPGEWELPEATIGELNELSMRLGYGAIL
jgi:Sulfotransferase family